MGKGIVVAASVVGLAAAAGSACAAAPSNVPRAVVLKVGQTQRFSAAKLRPGEKVRCAYEGHVISVAAPASSDISNGTVWTQPGTTHFHLHVTAKKRGGYVVDCGLGGFHWAPTVAGTSQTHRPTDPLAI